MELSFANPNLPEEQLRQDLEVLAGAIGERHTRRRFSLKLAEEFIAAEFRRFHYRPRCQRFMSQDVECSNIEVEIAGVENPDEIIIVGAHYDTIPGSPGANDNGSGVIGLLHLARSLKDFCSKRTLRFVAFANEEPPFFQTPHMGSAIYAKRCAEKNENIVAMINLETIGYYSSQPNSQKYPLPFMNKVFPSEGNFIAFVSNPASRRLLKQAAASFKRYCDFPIQSVWLPPHLTGVDWSDQWSFWQEGYPGLMITDTAPFRYPHYHSPEDTPDKINYAGLVEVLRGIEGVVRDLAKG